MEIVMIYYIVAIFLICFFTVAYLYWVLLRNQRMIIAKLDYIAKKLIDKK